MPNERSAILKMARHSQKHGFHFRDIINKLMFFKNRMVKLDCQDFIKILQILESKSRKWNNLQ